MKKYFFTLYLLMFSFCLFCQSAWIQKADQIDPDNYYGVTAANGMIGLVSSPEPMKVKDVVLNGVYDYYQRGRVSNILKTFNHVNMFLNVDDHRINVDNIKNYQQSLNMKYGILETTFDFEDKVTVKTEMLALRHLPYTSLVVVEIKAKKNVKITPASVIEAPNHLQDVRNYYAEIDRPHVLIPLMTSVGLSPSGSVKVAASNSFIFEEHHGHEPKLIHEDWDYNMHLTKFHKELKAGETYRFTVVASTCASTTYEDPHNEAERLSIYAKLEGTKRLLDRHKQAWDKMWESDIIVEGNDDLTRDIRFAIYHLYAFAREGTGLSLSPMGLSGLGYNGHVFWDTELWMYPAILMLKPEIARSILDYRFDRLDAAKQNAFAHGYDGAMFPWESAGDGSEDTPVWALTGPFQHHISGCIAWANWKYFEVTQDKEWLRERGWPILRETAKFWVSRVDRNGSGQYDIVNVIGANEYAENIDNNAFTNGMAKTNLLYAIKAAELLGLTPDPDWKHVAENIPILKMNDGTTKENASYDGEKIKQADVNLLAYPLSVITSDEEVKKDLDYYEPRMDKFGPAMGPAILSILHNQLGETKKAEDIFYNSYKRNEVPPFGVISETAGGTNPYFATGAGGMLQAVLAGFGGLRIGPDGIMQIETDIPASWRKLILKGIGQENITYEVR